MADFDFLSVLELASDNNPPEPASNDNEAPCEDELALQIPSGVLAIQEKQPKQVVCSKSSKPVYKQRRNFASLKGRVGKGRHGAFAERALLACHMRKTHPESLGVISLLAPLSQHLGRIPEAQALLGEVQEAEALAWQDLKEKRQRLGDTLNPELRESLTTLQQLLQCQGRPKEVEAVMWELLKSNRADMEKGKHAETRDGLDWLESTLLATLLAEARVSEAEHLLKEDLELKRRTLGNENMSTLNTLEQLASLLQQQGRHAEAEPLLQEAIKGKRAPYIAMRQTLEASDYRPVLSKTAGSR